MFNRNRLHEVDNCMEECESSLLVDKAGKRVFEYSKHESLSHHNCENDECRAKTAEFATLLLVSDELTAFDTRVEDELPCLHIECFR